MTTGNVDEAARNGNRKRISELDSTASSDDTDSTQVE